MYISTNTGKVFTIDYAIPTNNKLYILIRDASKSSVHESFENPNETTLLVVYDDDDTVVRFIGYKYLDSINDKVNGTFSILLKNSEA